MRITSWRGVHVCWLFALSLYALAATHTANAQVTNGGGASAAQEPSVTNWLLRLNEASRNRAYTGTFVLSAAMSCRQPESGMCAMVSSNLNGWIPVWPSPYHGEGTTTMSSL